MTLDPRARAALEAVRQRSTGRRFAVEAICGSSRHRLSVYYQGAGYRGAPGSDEFRLGLAYSEDADALRALRSQLEDEERGGEAAAR